MSLWRNYPALKEKDLVASVSVAEEAPGIEVIVMGRARFDPETGERVEDVTERISIAVVKEYRAQLVQEIAEIDAWLADADVAVAAKRQREGK